MFTRRKRKSQRNTKRKRRRNSERERNNKKKTKKTKKNRNQRKNKKIYRGGEYTGEWLTYDELPEDKKDELCSLCHVKFSETPDKVIYKTECGHLFHNNCLNDYCEHHSELKIYAINCPICRKDLGWTCINVDAFSGKYLDSTDLSKKAKEIYEK
jgi:hypothetical protein